MFLQKFMHRKIAVTVFFLLISFTMLAQDAPAAEKTVTSSSNLLSILLTVTAVVLIFVVWAMGQVLIALSRQLLNKSKAAKGVAALAALMIFSLLPGDIMAQATTATDAAKVLPNYGGVSATTFYFFVAVIGTEIAAILFLFFSIRRVFTELMPEQAAGAVKESKIASVWSRLDQKFFTKAIPVEKEADHLLDHDYDGIQELDNSLPPWWKYGFYFTIGFAVLYLLNFHVFGNGKNPTQEYAAEMQSAKIAQEAYDANNKDKVDESKVPMADAAGIKIGQEHYLANCVACHGAKGEGGVGPNLTDNYWLHKGSLNDIFHTIKVGYADKGMQSWASKFNPKEMSQIASFVKTLKGTNPPNGKAPQGDEYKEEATAAGAGSTDSSKLTKTDTTVKK